MSDYESGFVEVIKQVYSNNATRHVGCYFHTCQAIYRKVQEIGLQVPYNSTVWVRTVVKSLMALPLLYQHLVNDQFDQIVSLVDERLKKAKKLKRTANDSDQCEAAREEIRLCEILHVLLNYFEQYWINTVTPAMFCVQGLQHRTNNLAEGFHNRFSRRLNEVHANVWKVISTFIDEEYHAYQKMVLIRTGVQKKANVTARQIAYQERINKLYVLYDKTTINASQLLEGLTFPLFTNVEINLLLIYIIIILLVPLAEVQLYSLQNSKMPFYQLWYSEETKNWVGLLDYIKNNVPVYINAEYPSAMTCIDIKLKEFVQTANLQEEEKIQFCKAHDVQGTPSSYGKIYYAERRNGNIHLMATIKKGQKAAAGALTVEVLSTKKEIFIITAAFLEHLKTEGIYFPYLSLWNKLRNLYDVPRKRVRNVVKLLREHVFVSKKHLVEIDYDFTTSSNNEYIVLEAEKSNQDDQENITTTSELVSCDEESPIKDTLTSSIMDSDDNDFQQSIVSQDTIANVQHIDFFCQSADKRETQKQFDDEIKQQNRLISQLTMWNDFAPINSKRRTNTTKLTTTIRHKRLKES
ncbi:unnamed protein product [Rotaria sp. Silwood2]|nr:unnamed protein product [Rotaria sp. Silwood2]